MDYKKERVYEVKDFVSKVLKHWKWMLIAGIICGVLCGALKYVKDVHSVSVQNASISKAGTVADQVEALPKTEKEKIKNLASLNLSLREVSDYKENSYLMSIDPYNVSEDVLQYRITDASEEDYTAIKHYYDNEIHSQDILDQMKKVLGIDDSSSSISKCIAVSFNNNNDLEEENNIMTITLRSGDQSSSEEMAKIIKNQIKEAGKNAADACGQNKMKLMTETYYEVSDSDLLSFQQDTDKQIFDLSNEIYVLTNTLDEEQKDLADSYLAELAGEEASEISISTVSFSKKWAVAGFMAGIVLVMGICGILWLADPRIQSLSEFKDNLSLPIYGVLEQKYGKEDTSLISSQIALSAAKQEAQSIIITGSSLKQEDKQIMDIVTQLKAEGLETMVYEQFLKNADALRAAAAQGIVLFVEQIGASRYCDVKEEIDKCKELDIKVMGCILEK